MITHVPLKVGIFGPQGSGKSTTAALFAAALSAEVYNRAPVYVQDPELAWQFLRRRIFDVEKIELIQRTEKSFKGMADGMREAEKLGACVWIVDPLTLIWNELLESFHAKTRGFMDYGDWADLKSLWKYDYTDFFLNTPMCCIAAGRLGDVREDIQDERSGKIKSTKVGTQFKAGGSESFGYEPHLLIEMSLERKAKVKAGSRLEGEGRIIHRGDVLKDRTWALNGKVLRWSDKPGYQKGGYRQVWEAVKSHFDEVQATMAQPQIAQSSTQDILGENGESQYYRDKQRKDVTLESIENTMILLWPGQTADAKRTKLLLLEGLFAVRSWKAVEAMPLLQLEDGLLALYALEERIKHGGQPADEGQLHELIALAKADVKEPSGKDMTLLEVLGRKSLARVEHEKATVAAQQAGD